MDEVVDRPKLLLIDTCGEGAGVALCAGEEVQEIEALSPRGASAEIVAAVRRLLERAHWRLDHLDGIGVVNGPGSFTGVRAGLAAAKGLAEAGAVRLAAVSRLEVLAESVGWGSEDLAVLDAGRNALYVRAESEGKTVVEWLCGDDDLRLTAAGRGIVVAEQSVAVRLAALGLSDVVLRPLAVIDALRPVLCCLRAGGSDVALVDANYVRRESDIYRATEPRVTQPEASVDTSG